MCGDWLKLEAGKRNMRLDAHQHFWHYDPARDTWITDEMAVLKRDFLPDELRVELEANRVDGSIAVQAAQSEEETRFLLDLASRHPFIKGVIGWVDLCAEDISERLARFSREEKLCGFRHIVQAEPDDRFMLRDDFSRGIAALKEFGFTYDILIYERQLPAAIELVERHPEQRFILDHIAKPRIRERIISPWAERIRAIARHPNVYCKVSGLVTEADWRGWRRDDFRPYLDVVFEAFGPERVMFGSDWPVCLLAASYRQVVELIETYMESLTVEEKAGIFGKNAARVYGVKPD
jgi:L-fuconolactonase